MRRLLYLLAVAGGFLFSSCHDLEVGYLVTGTAEYPDDTLRLYNIEDRLQELKDIQTELHRRTAPLQEEKAWWEEEELNRDDDLYDFDVDVLEPAREALEDPSLTAAQREELEKQVAELEIEREKLRDLWQEAGDKIWDLNQAINKVIVDLGFNSERELINQIERHQNTLDYKIPWVTSPIDGVLGTEPLMYSIAEVSNEDAAKAELFRKSLTIMGGGRMYVEQNLEAPAGVYKVSILIENEGQSALLKDVFTFIVEE